jgi:asparagine synthetase B (glutamine-hydrolysing)
MKHGVIPMFFAAVSGSTLDPEVFKRIRLKTVTAKLGNFNLLLAFDDRFTTLSEQDSRLLLMDLVTKPDEDNNPNPSSYLTDGPAENLVLSILFADLKKNSLLVRRPFHGRSLYYRFDKNNNTIYITTHIKLFEEAGLGIEEDEKAVAEYFFFGNVLSPLTLYKDTFKVTRGQTLQIECKSDALTMKVKNSPISIHKRTALDENEVTETITNLLRASLSRLKPMKNKVAISFSGGLDSSVLAQLLETEEQHIHFYSMSYPFEDFENNKETLYARTAAKALHLDYVHFKVDLQEYLNDLIEMIAEGEAPIWYYLQTPLFVALLKHPPNDEEIIVFGEGADSLFGNPNHRIMHYLTEHHDASSTSRLNALVFSLSKNRVLQKLIRGLLRLVGKQGGNLELASAKIDGNFEDPNNFLWKMSMIGDEKWTTAKFKFSLKEIVRARKERLEPFLKNPMEDLISLSNLLGYESLSALSKIGEKHGRIILYPYLDDALMTYVFQLPWKPKLKEPKHFLRQVARKIGVPDFIITRPKSGFGTKAEYWALPGKIFEPIVTLSKNVFSQEEFRSMQSTNPKKNPTFWFMINYALWKEIFINNKSPDLLKQQLSELLKTNPSV